MNKTPTLLAVALSITALCMAFQTQAAPKIQFDRLVYDFGKTSQVAVVSGVFKFKNVGDSLLKVEPPKPSCGCTVAELKPDTLQPGETGELPFTLHLGQVKAQFEKRIAVKSNDPKTPEVSLTLRADYTPLYEINPLTLAPKLVHGVNEATEFTTITRTDGNPLRLGRLVAFQPWITARVEPAASTEKADKTTARIRIAIQRQGPPRRFTELIHVYTAEDTNTPASSIFVYGQFMGEVSLTPESLYWNITDAAKAPKDIPEAVRTRRVSIRSGTGQPIEVKNPKSTLKNITIELIPTESGKTYELVARLDQVPSTTVSGNVTVETSVKAQPVIELPVIVHVFKP